MEAHRVPTARLGEHEWGRGQNNLCLVEAVL